MKNKKGQIAIIGVIILIVVVGAFFFFKSSSNEGSPSESSISKVPASGNDVSSQTSETRTFDITAKQWDFSPSTMTVNEGDTVILNIESIDVTHGFKILEFGVSERLEPGKTTTVEFLADKKGTFTFFCNVQCGIGHSGMNGKLIVN